MTDKRLPLENAYTMEYSKLNNHWRRAYMRIYVQLTGRQLMLPDLMFLLL